MNRLFLALLLSGSGRAVAFTKPIHATITRKTLSVMGFGADSTAAVVRGNLAADEDAEKNDPKAHFDNERFSAGSARIKSRLQDASDALGNCDADAAREQLGRILHSVQDFCSHSNWIETHEDGDAIDFLALTDPAPDLVCDRRTHLGGLTTGYYPDNRRPVPHKCIHAELNKDTPKRPGYAKARAKAAVETIAMVRLLERAVTARFGTDDGKIRWELMRDAASARECRPAAGR